MDKLTHVKEDWYLIFKSSTLKHWVMPWLNPSFQHCLMVREDDGLWIIEARMEQVA